jgi:hypothetical protein
MEKLVLGLRLIFAAKGEAPGGLPLPQLGKKTKAMVTTAQPH